MMIVTEQVLDQLTEEAKKSIRLRQHFDLRNSSEDNSQRMLNALEPGTVIPVHRHRNTSEVVSVIRGSVRQNFYDNNGTLIESFIVAAGESLPLFVVPMGIWHNMEALQSGTVIFEAKDGMYAPLLPEDVL